MEVARPARAAPGFGERDECTADAGAVMLAPDADDVELHGLRGVLLQAEKADVRRDGERR